MGWLRLLLALVVLDSHFGFIALPVIRGHDAVEAFFVVSGFFIAMVLAERYLPPDRTGPGKRAFLLNRLLRIYPAYLVMVCVGLGLFLAFGLHPLVMDYEYSRVLAGNPRAGSLLATLQTGLVGQEYLFVLKADPAGGLSLAPTGTGSMWRLLLLPQAWSLSLELCFYFLAPWLALRRTRVLCTLLAASLALRLGAFWLGWEAATILWKRFLPSEFWLFLTGMLSYRVLGRIEWRTLPRTSAVAALAGLAGLILFGKLLPLPWRTLALAGALFLCMPMVFHRFRNIRLDRLAGDLSYPFYLVHMHAIALVEAVSPESPDPSVWWPVVLLLTLAGAAPLLLCVEQPVNQLRSRLARPRLEPAPVPLAHP